MRGVPPYFQARMREMSARERRGGGVFRKGRLELIGGSGLCTRERLVYYGSFILQNITQPLKNMR